MLLGAFQKCESDPKPKFTLTQLLQLVKKLGACDKMVALKHCVNYKNDLHGLLIFLTTTGNKLADGVEKDKVEIAFTAMLEKAPNKTKIVAAIKEIEKQI